MRVPVGFVVFLPPRYARHVATVNVWEYAGLAHVRDIAEHADSVVGHAQIWIDPVPTCLINRKERNLLTFNPIFYILLQKILNMA